MRILSVRVRPSLLSLVMLSWAFAAACAGTEPERPPRIASATRVAREPSRPSPARLYAADEALRDALSGQWEYLGTVRWPGIERTRACVFRNDRVLVVNVYCAITETPAFRVDVYSPERGRVRIYAESNGPVSTRHRSEYFTFMVESEPPAHPQTQMPPLALTMSLTELRRYEQQRYGAYLPVCYGGERDSERQGGCLGALAARADEWAVQNRAFLEHANADWYRLVREMRALAIRYGKDP